MKKKIKSIGVVSVLLVSLVLSAIIGGIYGLILCISDLRDGNVALALTSLILGPILYGVLGALLNAFFAWIYNLVAARMGGIEITFEE